MFGSIIAPLVTPLVGSFVNGMLRALLAFLGGYLLHSGIISIDQVTQIISIILGLIAAGWSVSAKVVGSSGGALGQIIAAALPTIDTASLQAAILAQITAPASASPTPIVAATPAAVKTS